MRSSAALLFCVLNVLSLACAAQSAELIGTPQKEVLPSGSAGAIPQGERRGPPGAPPDEAWKPNYRIRAVLRILHPVDLTFGNDRFQEVRLLHDAGSYVDVEVIYAPYAPKGGPYLPNPLWREPAPGAERWLRSGPTTNWDTEFAQQVLLDLEHDGIDLDALSDVDAVSRIASWAFSRVKSRKTFTALLVRFPDGKPAVVPEFKDVFWRERGAFEWTAEEQFDRELLGKQMYATRSVGECSSQAIYLTTVLRAIGIPTRMIFNIPPIDRSREDQIRLLQKGIRQPQVRHQLMVALGTRTPGLYSHVTNEVFVGNQWSLLNRSELNYSILCADSLGLMTRINTFSDWSDLELPESWGGFFALKTFKEVFPGDNPYYALELEDYVLTPQGRSTPPGREHTTLTICAAYVFNSPDRPAFIPAKPPRQGSCLALLRVNEWFQDDNYFQLREFVNVSDGSFELVPPSGPSLQARLTGAIYTMPDEGVRDVELEVLGVRSEQVAPGITYTIKPRNQSSYPWKVAPGVSLACP